jgi:calcineurin-like phosphoesterase family protein
LSKKGLDVPRLIYAFPSQYDVGVDNNNYTPVSWYEVDRKIQEQIKNSLENEDISNS